MVGGSRVQHSLSLLGMMMHDSLSMSSVPFSDISMIRQRGFVLRYAAFFAIIPEAVDGA